jgi:hypothetical protein
MVMYNPTVNLAGGNITACYHVKCWVLGQSAWEEGPAPLQSRTRHTSAVLPGGGILLVGGQHQTGWTTTGGTTTEIVQPNHLSVAGFNINPGRQEHCSAQTGPTSIVLTGGDGTETLVNEYSGIDQGDRATSKDLPSLKQGRRYHACGMYTVGGSKVSSPPPPSTQGNTGYYCGRRIFHFW